MCNSKSIRKREDPQRKIDAVLSINAFLATYLFSSALPCLQKLLQQPHALPQWVNGGLWQNCAVFFPPTIDSSFLPFPSPWLWEVVVAAFLGLCSVYNAKHHHPPQKELPEGECNTHSSRVVTLFSTPTISIASILTFCANSPKRQLSSPPPPQVICMARISTHLW